MYNYLFKSVRIIISLNLFSIFASATTCDQVKAPLGDVAVSYETITKLIICNHFTRIDQVLKALPPRLRSNYMLVYKSHSRHLDVTFDQPRIIIEDERAKIIIAAAGNRDQINGQDLEIIETPDAKKDSIFHAITFAEQSAGAPKFDSVPSSVCMACHRQHLSPNFESYPAWPGLYGSGSGQGPIEDQKYGLFLSQLKKYQHHDANDIHVSRYTALTDLLEGKIETSDLEFRNHSFSSDIGYNNQARLISRITSDVKFDALSPALQAAAQGCGNIENFFPARLQSNLKLSLNQYLANVEMDTFKHFLGEMKTANQLTQNDESFPTDWLFFFSVKPMIPVGYVLKYGMGLDIDDYSITFQSSIYNSHHTLGGFESNFIFNYGASCESLKVESLNRLN